MVIPNQLAKPGHIQVGRRIECAGHFGTVKYVGEVGSSKGIWLGIDWDDPRRGKHDGSIDGHSYFHATFGSSGSFVRREKVNFGQSCLEAIQERYGAVDSATAGVDKEGLIQLQRELNVPFITMVGFDDVVKKQSKLDQLVTVGLRNYLVNGAGDNGLLGNLCPALQELDLSKNLLDSWQSLADIVKQLKELRVINASENLMQLPEDPRALVDSFKHLEHLILGNVRYNWREILLAANMWPLINTLQVPFNSITNLETPSADVFSNLESLDLEGNGIKDWEEIMKLGSIETLKFLNISDTGIEEITLPVKEQYNKTIQFNNLHELIINGNKINDWKSVAELDKLEKLEELKFRDNPVLRQEKMETNRQLIISNIGNLKVLNCVDILQAERRESEYDYLKRYGDEWRSSKSDVHQLALFQSEHPRYEYLVEKYGPPDEGKSAEQKLTTLKSRLLTLYICSASTPDQSFLKSVPSVMSVQKLIGLVQKLFRLQRKVPTLTFVQAKVPGIEIPLDKPLKELNFYSVESGDKIYARW